MTGWEVERVVHFDFRKGNPCIDGFVHFGFHDRKGRHYVLEHQKHGMAFAEPYDLIDQERNGRGLALWRG